MRSRRALTASKTLTVPDDVDERPERRVGSHERHLERREVDDVRDRVVVERAPERVEVGDVALDDRHPSSASSPMTMRRRRGSVARSNVTTVTPSSTSALTVQAPMQPRAPVTRKRSAGRERGASVAGSSSSSDRPRRRTVGYARIGRQRARTGRSSDGGKDGAGTRSWAGSCAWTSRPATARRSDSTTRRCGSTRAGRSLRHGSSCSTRRPASTRSRPRRTCSSARASWPATARPACLASRSSGSRR